MDPFPNRNYFLTELATSHPEFEELLDDIPQPIVEYDFSPALDAWRYDRWSPRLTEEDLNFTFERRDETAPVDSPICETTQKSEDQHTLAPESSCVLCDQPDDVEDMITCQNQYEQHGEVWFHYSCVDLTNEEAKKYEEWFCPDCIATRKYHQIFKGLNPDDDENEEENDHQEEEDEGEGESEQDEYEEDEEDESEDGDDDDDDNYPGSGDPAGQGGENEDNESRNDQNGEDTDSEDPDKPKEVEGEKGEGGGEGEGEEEGEGEGEEEEEDDDEGPEASEGEEIEDPGRNANRERTSSTRGESPEVTLPKRNIQAWNDNDKQLVNQLMAELIQSNHAVAKTEKKWEWVSDHMKSRHGIDRSAGSIKNYWNRHGRLATGLDERKTPKPNKLVTGSEDPDERKRKRQAGGSEVQNASDKRARTN